MRIAAAVPVLCLLIGCPADDSSPEPPVDAASDTDAIDDPGDPSDVADDPDPGPEIDPDEPGPLRVGVGRQRLPAPVGIGTAGYGPFTPDDGVTSRYAENFPSTVGIYTHPTLHAVAVEGPHQTVVFLRSDTVGVSMEIREAILLRITAAGGPDLSQGLLFAATHTHSGPGRLVKNVVLEAGFDTFFPAFYDRLIEAGARAVLDALEDLEPARFGYTVIDTDALHGDRRCESPDFLDGRMPVLRFDTTDGKVKALVMTYSAHGTIVDIDKRRLSRDFHGGIELKIEEQFDHPVTALFFNSWSGDTSPETHPVDEDHGIPSDYNGIEAAGNVAAALVMDAIDGIELADEATVRAANAIVPFSREAMGYEEGIFQFEYGAVYCGIGAEAACFGEGDPPDPKALSNGCVPFGEDFPAPDRTTVGLTRLGSLYLATLPGEPGTELGVIATSAIQTNHGLEDVLLVGYAQDYVGYSLTEEDWYQGGYEASGAIWGPKQGDWLNQHLIEFADHFVSGAPLSWEPPEPRPTYDLVDVSFAPEPASGEAAVIVQPDESYSAGETLIATVAAGDPWLSAPLVTLERQEAGGFEPVIRKNGRALDSDGYHFELLLAADPPYEAQAAPTTRTFEWTIVMPTLRGAPSTDTPLDGTYRLRITGEIDTNSPYELTTDPFSITPI